MRIVIDTNVFISATFWKGDSFKILEKVQNGELELVLSKDIIDEYNRVLNYEEITTKVKIKELEANFILGELVAMSLIVTPMIYHHTVKNDPDDDKFIDAAIQGHAKYIISQDRHLLDIKESEGVKILKPEDFLKLLD